MSIAEDNPGPELRQNAARGRYEFDVDGATAIAVYRAAPGVLTVTHTEVPAALRGQGIGSRMVRAVLTDVRAQGLKVVARCPFVADYIARHPEFADLLA
jgi:predicted GNAT family acetyltransferase